MKQILQNRGFTLVELMITIVASSVVFITVALILIMAFQSWRTNNAYVEIRRDIAMATDMMTRDIRESDYPGVSAEVGLLTVYSNTASYAQIGETLVYTSGSDSMVLIPEALKNFNTVKQNDGVELFLEIDNADFNITLTNEVFVNTRN